MEIIESVEAQGVIAAVPEPMRKKLNIIRQLIFSTATEIDAINKLEETLKWGEPAYVTKQGSTIRLNQKKNTRDEYAVYFHCKTKLIDTFKEYYNDTFKYEGNRAIVFNVKDEIPMSELKQCIVLSLTYQRVNKLPMLGL